ncbi:uncharacterized protein LOC115751066 [Rhodamnia argentea]|uniref:Uncharacterized protein LOC115751066 n=1 Tax=Rhodamnia argentea TaxID=178133 RepID=A0A8B8QBW0_9MYRT|nr:uncharacterized protein LOC115751066 [Rhodamnia argentea]
MRLNCLCELNLKVKSFIPTNPTSASDPSSPASDISTPVSLPPSLFLMASAAKFPYQRLKTEGDGDGDGDAGGLVLDGHVFERYRAIVRSKLWYARLKRVGVKRRFKLRVPGLRRLLRRRARLVRAARVSCAKVLRRLKESQSHFGDLFAGNYLFLQVNPTPVKKHLERSAAGERGRAYGVGGHGSSPKVSVQRFARY